MSFLAPWFFAGAAAIALPVIFHLVRQSIRKKRMFSSLMFLKPTPPKIKRRNRLENILLLILRCAMLLLLAAAFTRPFFKQPADAAVGGGSNEMVAVLIDTSASMQRGSNWDEALETAEDLIDDLHNLPAVALLTFDRQTRTMISFEEWARTEPSQRESLWRERLSVVEPTHGGTWLGNAMVAAAELLEDARSRNDETVEPPSGRLIVISDFQSGSRLDGLAGFNWPKQLRVEMRSPDYQSESNAGIHPVASDPNAVLSAVQTNNTRVFLSNASDSTTELFEIAWADDAGRALPPTAQVYLPPGQSRVARLPSLTNTHPSRILLTGDGETFDNLIYVVPETPETIRVASITEDDPDKPGSLSFFLKNVFQSTTRQVIDFTNYTNPSGLATDAQMDLLIATDTPGAGDAIKAQLDSGHSVLLVLDHDSPANELADVLGLGSLNVNEGQDRNYALLGKIDFEHPLFAPFLDSRFSDFSGIHFWRYRRVNPESLPDARVLAAFDSRDPALIEVPRDGASLYVLTTTWRQSDSRLALSSKFVPLLYSFLEMNRPPREDGQSLIVGDTIAMVTTDPSVQVNGPDGSALTEVTLSTTFDQPGIYEVTMPDRPSQLVAVNIDAAESRTAPLPEEDLVRIGVPLSVDGPEGKEARLARELQQKDTETEAQQKNWRWLLAAAVAVFLIESWFAGRSVSSVSAATT